MVLYTVGSDYMHRDKHTVEFGRDCCGARDISCVGQGSSACCSPSFLLHGRVQG